MMTIGPVDTVSGELRAMTLIAPAKMAEIDFSSALGAGLARADSSLRAADQQLRNLSAGDAVALHDVMIAMEQARMDLTLVVEVRNRLLEAYQELTRMQL
jgi:flagellar hook-basal body complex protein FliE